MEVEAKIREAFFVYLTQIASRFHFTHVHT